MRCCPNMCCTGCAVPKLDRRGFLTAAAGAVTAGLIQPAPSKAQTRKEPDRQRPIKTALKIQPALMYDIPARREARSWRSWGGVQTEQDVAAEKERIGRELAALSKNIEFPCEIAPLASVQTADQAAAVARGTQDLTLIYAAEGGGNVLEALAAPNKWNLIFLRHRSGPVYLWYEIAHPRFLRKTVDEFGAANMGNDDVVVDSQTEIATRLRALYGLKNTLGKRIVAVGGPSGWGAGGRQAPERARDIFQLDIQTVPYSDLGERITKARQNESLVKRCRAESDRYLSQKGITLETRREFVENSFVLTEVFRDLLDEFHTDAITINQCMTTIMPLSKTTACLPLSILNDDGYMAFCESDFVVIPSGILLHYIASKPVFLNDPTHPHDGLVTLAHCTGPRRMDGQEYEDTRILTHFESDYGAAPKVEMRRGQKVTNIIPSFSARKYVGLEAEIVDHPFLPICRTQIDVGFKADTDHLLAEMGGFHWMTCYGDYLHESAYALKKLGATWVKA